MEVVGPDHPDLPAGDRIDGVVYRRLPLLDRGRNVRFDILRDFFWSRKAAKLLPEADVTVTNCFWLPWLLRSRRHPIRRRIGVLNMHIQRFPKGQMWLYRGVDRISTVSQAIVDGILDECPEYRDRIELIGNPVDLEIFHPAETPVPRDRSRILFTGRIHPEKGLHLLVEAWTLLRHEGVDLDLRLVGPASRGDGGGGEEYVRRLQSLAGDATIELPGPVADPTRLADELRNADIYCYPSIAHRGEASPVAPLEAMACGLPPVVADLPQYAAYIHHERSGLVFERGSGEARRLAGALGRLVGESTFRQTLAEGALASARRFGLDEIAEAYLADFQTSIDALAASRRSS